MSRLIKANPLRDPGVFCNSPPCPFCFDLVDEDEATARSGLEEFYFKMVGTYSPPSELRATLDELAEKIHKNNLVGAYDPPGLSPAEAVEAYDNARQEERIALQGLGVIRAVNAEARAKVVAKRKQTVVLDNVKITIKKGGSAAAQAAALQEAMNQYPQQTQRGAPYAINPYAAADSAPRRAFTDLEIMMAEAAKREKMREIAAKQAESQSPPFIRKPGYVYNK